MALTTELPLRIGDARQFALVRSTLRAAGFAEPYVCQTLRIPVLSELGQANVEALNSAAAPGRLAFLLKAFLFGEFIPRAAAERLFESTVLDAFLALDLLRRADDAAAYYSPVFFYPVAGLLIASDRHTHPDGSPFIPPPDIVFPAIDASTLLFLRMLPQSPAASALDLGSGSGVAALMLSRVAQRAVASDLTARAQHFADFNRHLNQCENVEVVQGDLYAAVQGRSFDRIVSHLPYVPNPQEELLYCDGGITGEALTRRAIAGLPQYLRPGGGYYSICVGLDTASAPFEERVREWLGAAQPEFDVVVAVSKERTLDQFIAHVAAQRDLWPSELAQFRAALTSAGMRRLIFGALVVRRHADANDRPQTWRLALDTELAAEAETAVAQPSLHPRMSYEQPVSLDFLSRMW